MLFLYSHINPYSATNAPFFPIFNSCPLFPPLPRSPPSLKTGLKFLLGAQWDAFDAHLPSCRSGNTFFNTPRVWTARTPELHGHQEDLWSKWAGRYLCRVPQGELSSSCHISSSRTIILAASFYTLMNTKLMQCCWNISEDSVVL